MSAAVILCLILTVATAVARFLMHHNLAVIRSEIAEREVEQKRVKARQRVLDDQLDRLRRQADELDSDASARRRRLAEVNEQIRLVKEISRQRIERELAVRN